MRDETPDVDYRLGAATFIVPGMRYLRYRLAGSEVAISIKAIEAFVRC
jgi:hypothetical protein